MTEFAGIALACCVGAVFGTIVGHWLYQRLDLWWARREAAALMAAFQREYRAVAAMGIPQPKGGVN